MHDLWQAQPQTGDMGKKLLIQTTD
jgi:hypothetical protein